MDPEILKRGRTKCHGSQMRPSTFDVEEEQGGAKTGKLGGNLQF